MTRYIMQFSKTGTSCYISHLDLVRVFHRAFKRAGIKLEYSKGFNPHPKMGFAQPLSLGYTGMREYIEFETKEEHAPEDLGEMLKAQMPDGINIHLCQFLEYPKKTLASVTEAAVYTVSIPLKKSVQMKADACKELYLGQDQIIVLKKQKKKKDLVEIDIKPKIREIEFLPLSKSLQIKMKIDAGSNSNLSPEQVIDSVLRCFAIDTDRSEISVTRHLIFFRKMGNAGGRQGGMGPDGQDNGEKRNIEKYAKRTAEQGDDPGDRWLCSRLYLAGACSAAS